ncbi:MAG: hypothetical protein ABW148_06455 [Sedimenticola sp.]
MHTTHDLVSAPYGQRGDLIANIESPRYVLTQHRLEAAADSCLWMNPEDARSFIVIEGEVEVMGSGESEWTSCQRLQGWHVQPGHAYSMRVVGDAAVVIEAGDNARETERVTKMSGEGGLLPLSGYTVDKPWGYEVWLTENLDDPDYALKIIAMNMGNRSSLQSHEVKLETNYVIKGEATVLAGVVAPEELTATINPDELIRTVYGVGEGWSSIRRELHRVVAEQDYIAVEVSTPELDDVIRWQDDSQRDNGRIDEEHVATA